ncbi:MAG: hypothetical protein ACRCZP_02545 [Phycicoccus sp.]
MTSPYPLDVRVELQVGAGGTTWVDVTADVELGRDEPITIQRGRRDQGAQVDTSTMTVRLWSGPSRVVSTLGSLATYIATNTAGPYWGVLGRGTPIRLRVGQDVRYVGEVASWPPRRAQSGHSSWVELRCAGPLRRLEQSGPIGSALSRHLRTVSPRPAAYWPLTDGPASVEGAPGVSGGAPLRRYTGWHPLGTASGAPVFGAGRLADWLEPVLERPGKSSLTVLAAPVPGSAYVDNWTVDFMYSGEQRGAVSAVIDVSPQYLGGVPQWPSLALLPATRQVRVSYGGVQQFADAPALFDGLAHHVRWNMAQLGGALWVLHVDGVQAGTGGLAYTVPPPTSIALAAGSDTGDAGDHVIGHVAVWPQLAPPLPAMAAASRGWPGEAAGRRVERLCAEELVPLAAVGDLGLTELVGPQPLGTLFDLCQDAAAADGGVLYEPRQVRRLLSDFEVGVDAWAGGGSPAPAVARSTVRAYAGSASLLITWATGTPGVIFAAQTVPQRFIPGFRYTVSCQVWVPTGSPHVTWCLAGIGFGETTTVRDQWQKINITFDATAATHVVQLWQVGPATAGQQAWVDDVHVVSDERGLAYRTRQSLYGQIPALTLDAAAEEVAGGVEVEVDDRDLHNRVTVTRRGGTPQTYEQVTGPMSTARPPAGAGVHDQSVTLSVASDAQSAQHAAWRVHLGTDPSPRVESVGVDLALIPALRPQMTALDIGDRLDVTGLPADLCGDLSLLVEGYTETVSDQEWRMRVAASSAAPWMVGRVADPVLGRADTSGSSIVGPLGAAAGSVEVAYRDGAPWTTAPGDVPLTARIGREVRSVTAIAASAVTYVGAGAAVSAVSGPVTPPLPAGWQPGDLLVVAAACQAPSVAPLLPGWAQLGLTSNMILFGRVAAAGETAPTVSPSSTPAGLDVTAQMIALRSRWHDISRISADTEGQADAADTLQTHISLPSLTVKWPHSVILWAGWKRDDWTSVTGPGTLIAATTSTAGNDHGLAWSYQIQGATPANVPASQYTVSGGALAATRSLTVALRADKQLWTVAAGVLPVPAGADVRLATPSVIAL